LLLSIFDIAGYILVFNLQRFNIRSKIKRQIQQELPLQQLTRIIDSGIEISELGWKEENVFRYHAEMYHIV
jgi:hypothetical protein